MPHASLEPDDVVRIVMEALQNNDDPGPDCGIRTAFNFASPNNRVVTGPLPDFIEMVKNSTYAPMINSREVRYEPVVMIEDRAQQTVWIVDADGSPAAYLFELSRQEGPLWRGCWLVDSAVRLE